MRLAKSPTKGLWLCVSCRYQISEVDFLTFTGPH